MATEINATSDKAEELLGLTMGSPVQTQPEVKHIEDTLTVNVHGKSLTDTGKTKNVSGIYNGFGSQLTVDKDLIVRLKNDAPASKRELGHYYMSAVYAGYGGKVPRLSKDNPDRDYGDTNIHVKGNVDIDAIGVGLQANQRGHIIVDGGGRPVPNVEVDFFLKPASGEKKPEYFTAKTDQSGDAELPTVFKAGEVIQYRVAKTATDFKEAVELVGEFTVEAGNEYAGSLYTNGRIVLPYKLDDRAAQIGNATTAAQYGWAETKEGWKYFENAAAVKGWKQVDGKWYFFNAEGVMQKWWVKDGNTWYYLNGSGQMQTGWLQDGGKWYFLEASGAMKASQWFEVAGKWYHVDASGALSVNTTVDGYNVNANGEWV